MDRTMCSENWSPEAIFFNNVLLLRFEKFQVWEILDVKKKYVFYQELFWTWWIMTYSASVLKI